MKLENITISNYLRIGMLNVDLPDPVTIFAGANESGKSSIQNAIRFALTADPIRVQKKGDFKLLIKDGAKDGFSSVTVDGTEIKREIKSGKEVTDNVSVHLPESLPYILDAQKFAEEKQSKRRSFLIQLTNTKITGEAVAERMQIRGVKEDCIEKILPMIRSGFDAAHKESLNRAAEARAMWCGATGAQRYGAVIAATWKPEIPEDFDHKAYLEKETEFDQIKASIDQINIKKGGIIARLDEARKNVSKNDAAPFKQADLTKVNKQIEEAESLLRQQDQIKKDLNSQFFNAKESAPVTCCECGSLLKVEFSSEPGRGRVATCEPYKPMSDDEKEKLQSDIFTVSSNITKLEKELTAHKETARTLEAAKAAKKNKTTVTKDDINAIEKELSDINLLLDDRRNDYNALNDIVRNMQIIAEKIKDADGIEQRAQGLHQAVQNWSDCVDALAPDGIPAEILSDTLKPVNDRLRNTANITGWSQITITPTMEIVADGRRYSLLSESAQWRADVAIADAISYLSDIGVLIIDRFDVLDLPSRGVFMKWLQAIMGEYETVIAFGTLKSAPKLPDGMTSHWLESGELK